MSDQNNGTISEEPKAPVESPVNYFQVEADRELADFLGEPVKNGQVVEPPKEEEKKEEVKGVIEELKAPVIKEEAKAPIIDTDKVTDDIVKKLETKMIGDVDTKKEKDEVKELLENAPWKKENRDPSWEEALLFVANNSKDKIKREVMAELQKEADDEEAKTKEVEKQQEEQQKAVDARYSTRWDMEFADLEAQNKIPKVINREDPNDPGRKARLAIFTSMREMVQDRIKNNIDPDGVMSVKIAYYEKYKDPNAKPEGAAAPVNGAARSVSADESKGFTYQDVQNSTIESIMTGNK